MAASGGIFAPIALGAQAIRSAAKVLRNKVSAALRPGELQSVPVPVRNSPSGSRGQPVHPAAYLRQQRRLLSRWTHQNVDGVVRRFLSTASGKQAARGPRFDRSKFPVSNTSRLVAQFPGRAPFAHTLRPNLTGGALPRSAGGYGITGGGARYFSHTPAAPAQVMQNVSQAMRCFWLSGKRARFDGVNERGEKRYRTASELEDEACRKMDSVARFQPGSFIDFHLSPTITAMSPLAAAFPYAGAQAKTTEAEFVPTAYAYAAKVQKRHVFAQASPTTLHAAGFLDELSIDFARALKDLSATLGDIRRLSILGDLAIELVPDAQSPTLRVRFPGVDAGTVEALCDDLGITRGLVHQDKEFDVSAGVPVALKFPFAPGCNGEAKKLSSPGGSVRSRDGFEMEENFDYLSEAEEAFMIDEFSENPWISEPEGYGTLSSGDHGSDFEGLEGIYRFIEECDRAKGQFRA